MSEVFERIVGEHRGAIGRVCRHYEASVEARRDLEQDIFVAIWRALGGFRGDSSERTFVLRIAHNVAVTHVTRAARTRMTAESVELARSSPELVPEQRAELARVELRLRALDITSQQLVLLALEGCTMQEIAETAGLSVTNVTTRLSRLRRMLGEGEAP